MDRRRKTDLWAIVNLIVGLLSLVLAGTANGPRQAEAQTGAALIGKLEGPEVITDASQWPRTFNEAPQLAELVKQGKLPPVAERIGQDPLVIKPVHGIGKYGGFWRRGFSGPADLWNGIRCCSGPDSILYWEYTGNNPTPNIAKDWKVTDGGKTTIIFLRRGMKWSDGHPLTADDFVFWHDHVLLNKEITPTFASYFTINGQPGRLEKIDDFTIALKFPHPYHLLPDVLAGATQLGGPAWRGPIDGGGYVPAHYLKQFHPDFVDQQALDKRAEQEGYHSWVNLFRFKSSWQLNPELPVVTPWKTVTPITKPTWVLERNPYSVWVDTAGNQLPYIDKVVLTVFENMEIHNLRAIAGEYDYMARHVDIQKVPVFLENEAKGKYKLYLDPGDYGGDMIIKFNMSYTEDAEIRKWFDNRDFRRALSLGIDRDEINETFWLGVGTPRSVVPAAANLYYPGAKYDRLWATYEPDKANQMLDAIGLDRKNASGLRLRTDGSNQPLTLEVITWSGSFVQYTQIMEAIGEMWTKIGIKLLVKEVERGLGNQLFQANKNQMWAWNNDGSEHMFTFPLHVFPFDQGNANGPLNGLWFQTNGEDGEEPLPFIQEIMAKWRKAFGVPREERIKLGKEIWAIAANEIHIIGVIGLGPAAMGVRVAKTDLGNIPSRQYNSPDARTPSISRPVTFYWKSAENRQPQKLSIQQ
ncbi:Periplasmic alpha-galactoside-binding protein [Candidatus Entotheonellaceae bacterium PAL068K]